MSDLMDAVQKKYPIGCSDWVAYPPNHEEDNIIIMFDISSFSEEPPIFDRRKEGEKFRGGTYRPIIPVIEKTLLRNRDIDKDNRHNCPEGVYPYQEFYKK